MISRVVQWLLTHSAARLGGLLLLGIPSYFIYNSYPALAAIIAGVVGWVIGPAFLVRSEVRHAVTVGALAGFALSYAWFFVLAILLTVLDHPAAGRPWKDLAQGVFVESPILAGYFAYVCGFTGGLVAWLRLLLRAVFGARTQKRIDRTEGVDR